MALALRAMRKGRLSLFGYCRNDLREHQQAAAGLVQGHAFDAVQQKRLARCKFSGRWALAATRPRSACATKSAPRSLSQAVPERSGATYVYLSVDWIVENVALSLEPIPMIIKIIASVIPVAIRPYSIAVAALSSFTNLTISPSDNSDLRDMCLVNYHPPLLIKFYSKLAFFTPHDSTRII